MNNKKIEKYISFFLRGWQYVNVPVSIYFQDPSRFDEVSYQNEYILTRIDDKSAYFEKIF